MRVLLYSWNANNEHVLADNLIKQGYEIVWFYKECKHYTRDMELALEMIQEIHAQGVEAVVSFNYFPIISMICNTCGIPYYAWVYDCPHFTLYAKQLDLPCNHIGVFDREMVRHLEGYGIRTVSHVPLSVDTEYFNKVISTASDRQREKYQCDVSFVGSLYTDEHNYYDLLFDKKDDEHIRTFDGRMADTVRRQCFAYHENYLSQEIADGKIDLDIVQQQMEQQGLMLGEDYDAKPEDILIAAVLEKKVTVEERRILLTELQKMLCNGKEAEIDFRIYTASDTAGIRELHACNHGIVDYQTQMPLVFAGSKINLNISLRSIHSGIPLRVLDIMACGGFVLTNWQPEIAQYFKEGIEVATYSSLEECMEKVAYYLEHEEERRQIAASGRNKVREAFSYRIGLNRLLQ